MLFKHAFANETGGFGWVSLPTQYYVMWNSVLIERAERDDVVLMYQQKK